MMMSLTHLLILLVKCSYLVDTTYLDPRFENTSGLKLKGNDDHETMHQIKCTHNPNAPFNQYDTSKYSYNKPEYKYCLTDNLLDETRRKMTRVETVFAHPVSHFSTMSSTFEFLKKSMFVTEKIPEIENVLRSNYNNFDQLILDVTASKNAFQELRSANDGLESILANVRQQHRFVIDRQNMIRNLIFSINMSATVCNGRTYNDINIYKHIVSSYSVNEELEKVYHDMLETIEKIKNICEKTQNPLGADPIIAKTLASYNGIVETLSGIRNVAEEKVNTIKPELDTYSALSDKLDIDFSMYETKLDQTKNMLNKINLYRATIQNNVIVIEDMIDQVTTQVPSLSQESQDLLNLNIEIVTKNLNSVIIMEKDFRNFEALLKEIDPLIRDYSSKHSSILKRTMTTKQCLELTIETLQVIMDISNKLTYDNKYHSLLKLSEYYKSPWEYTLDTDATDITDYIETVDRTYNQLDGLSTNLYHHYVQFIIKFNELNSNGKKLEEQYNMHKIKTMPEIDNIMKIPNLETNPEDQIKLKDIAVQEEKNEITAADEDVSPTEHVSDGMSKGKKAALSMVLVFLGVILLIVGGLVYYYQIKQKPDAFVSN